MNSLLVFIRQEIEFLKDLNEGLYTEGDNSYYEGQDNGYNHILAFIDSLPEDDPLNDPRFNDGFDAGRAVQRIFDGTDEDSLPEEPLIPSNSVGLEEEIDNYFEGLWPGTETAEQCNTDLHFTPPAIMRLARHFAEWGAKCKDSLQVQETCKENQDSFTSLDEVLKRYNETKMKDNNLIWQDIKKIVNIADAMLDDPKMRIAIQNHSEEEYYQKVLKAFLSV